MQKRMPTQGTPKKTARSLMRDVQTKVVLAEIPLDGSLRDADGIVSACEKNQVDRKQVHARLAELLAAHEIRRHERVIGGHPRVWYHRLLDYNRPMPKYLVEGVLDDLRQVQEKGAELSEEEAYTFHARQTAIREFVYVWSITQALRAPSDAQADLVIQGYVSDVLPPLLQGYVRILRRAGRNDLILRELLTERSVKT